MKAIYVHETFDFKRNLDPRASLNIGITRIISDHLEKYGAESRQSWNPIFKYIINPFKKKYPNEIYNFKKGTFSINNFKTLNYACFLEFSKEYSEIHVYPIDLYKNKLERGLRLSKIEDPYVFEKEIKKAEKENLELFKPRLGGRGRFNILKIVSYKKAKILSNQENINNYIFDAQDLSDNNPVFLVDIHDYIIKHELIPFDLIKDLYREFGV